MPPVPTRVCAMCKHDLTKASYSGNQWSKAIGVSQCKGCVEGRRCAQCQRNLPRISFTASQWSKSLAVSRCAACVHGHPSDPAAKPVGDAGRHDNKSQPKFTQKDLLNHFDEGSFRWVARGIYIDGERAGQPCVCKGFKDGMVYSGGEFIYDFKCVDKALEIVNLFNQLRIVDRDILINIPNVWDFEVEGAKGMEDWVGTKFLQEPFIENYYKWNTNNCYVDNREGWPQVMQALSHFSYEVTGGDCLLCDLQGGVYEKHVVLTDPAFHSQRKTYGATDYGVQGIRDFFSVHTCNQFCRENWIVPASVK